MQNRMRTARLFFVLLPAVSLADGAEVRAVAEKYLAAITGKGDEAGRELLLGGVPMDAQLLTLENGHIVEVEPMRREEGDLARARSLMAELDQGIVYVRALEPPQRLQCGFRGHGIGARRALKQHRHHRRRWHAC